MEPSRLLGELGASGPTSGIEWFASPPPQENPFEGVKEGRPFAKLGEKPLAVELHELIPANSFWLRLDRVTFSAEQGGASI